MRPRPQPNAQRQLGALPADRVRSVSQVAAAARLLVEERFRLVWIGGEVSNFRRYASGHWYFSLKDDRAQLRCVMFANRNRFVRFAPADGMSVVLRGRLSIFEARGDFQAIVDHVEPAGEGALRAAFEQLKSMLAAEGLFAPQRQTPAASVSAPRGGDQFPRQRGFARRACGDAAALSLRARHLLLRRRAGL